MNKSRLGSIIVSVIRHSCESRNLGGPCHWTLALDGLGSLSVLAEVTIRKRADAEHVLTLNVCRRMLLPHHEGSSRCGIQ